MDVVVGSIAGSTVHETDIAQDLILRRAGTQQDSMSAITRASVVDHDVVSGVVGDLYATARVVQADAVADRVVFEQSTASVQFDAPAFVGLGATADDFYFAHGKGRVRLEVDAAGRAGPMCTSECAVGDRRAVDLAHERRVGRGQAQPAARGPDLGQDLDGLRGDGGDRRPVGLVGPAALGIPLW